MRRAVSVPYLSYLVILLNNFANNVFIQHFNVLQFLLIQTRFSVFYSSGKVCLIYIDCTNW